MRPRRLRPLLLFCLTGCFVDAVGAGDGALGGGGAAPSTASTTDGSTAAETTAAGTTTTSGMGGAGGEGGSPCADPVLMFDGDDVAQVASDDFQIVNDVVAGAWVFPEQNPAYVAGDGIRPLSIVLAHGSIADEDGFVLAFGEPNDDGVPVAGVIAYPFGAACVVGWPIAWNAWSHLAFRYNDNVFGNDLFFHLNGVEIASVNCSAPPPLLHDGPLVLGGRAGAAGDFFLGAIDDAFVRRGDTLPDITGPIGCGGDFVAAFNFDGGLGSACIDPLLELSLEPAPADPELGCLP